MTPQNSLTNMRRLSATVAVAVLMLLLAASVNALRAPVARPESPRPVHVATLDAVPEAGVADALADDPTSLTFTVRQTGGSCGYGSVGYTFFIGNTSVGTANSSPADCDCTGSLVSLTTADPAALALIGAPTCTLVKVSSSGQSYVAWARADITRPSGTERLCIADFMEGNNCADRDLCSGYEFGAARTWQNALSDTDGDGAPDCSDPDIDNDGIVNASDNCPSLANPLQLDDDSNGVGNACQGPDADKDEILDPVDNCPTRANSSQADADGDGIGDVCEPALVAVPWLGSELLAHQVTSGGSLVLQAVASTNGDGEPIAVTSATWDPGDGSGPQAVSTANSLALELTHTYTGALGQPFTATVSATFTFGALTKTLTDTFKVVIAADTRDTRVNMAIDKGLWNLHKRMIRSTVQGLPAGNWTNPSAGHVGQIAATASTVQAFEINNHRESGDRLKDPYVDDAARGLRWLLSGKPGALAQMGAPPQNGNTTDANGNGYGLVVSAVDHSPYITGQVMDAIVASGTPDKLAETGQATYVKGRKYKDIIQDLLDGYSYGMSDNTGGWHYTYNGTSGVNDTSASHWWAIGVLAAETWGLDAPEWVKSIQKTVGIPLMQAFDPATGTGDGHFGYNDGTTSIWDDATNVTAAGLILMNADDMAQTDPRFVAASNYINARFNASMGNFYTMYQTVKAMRTALDADGNPSPIALLAGSRDWYAGYADHLVANQDAAGAFTSTVGTAGSYIQQDMATSWAIIMLSPSLFTLPPVASCQADPNQLGTHGGAVTFTSNGSFHPDPDLTLTYTWTFDDGGATGAGATTTHTFGQPASFPHTHNVQVTVTASNGTSASSTCPVTIVDTNVRPTARPGGPYTACEGQPLTLDGATSSDQDGTIAGYEWDLTAPINFAVIDATTATTPFSTATPGTFDIGLRVTDSDGATGSAFTTVLVKPRTDPSCNQPPDAVDDSAATNSGVPVIVAVLGNDTDPNAGQTLTVTANTTPANGVAVLNGDGTFTYTPNLGFAGVDTFTYTIGDGEGGSDTATVTITVSKRSATVTADSATKVYGSADPAFGATATGFDPADGIVVGATRQPGENVGSYVTTATATGGTLPNYDVTYVPGTFAITKATPVATATGGTFTYDGQPHAGTCTVAGVGTDVLTGTIGYTPGSGEPVNAGTYTVTCDFAGDGNYEPASATAILTIDTAAATVTAPSGTKVYGSADPAMSATATGFVAADGITLGFTREAGEDVATYVTTATAAGAALPNYTVTYVPGILAITPAPLTITADSFTRHYGTPNPVLTVQYSAFQFADGPGSLLGTLTVTTSATQFSPVGTYPIQVSGVSSPNYTVTFVDGTLTITNTAPMCDAAAPSVSLIWPPNHQWVPVTLNGATDPDGDPLVISVVGIFQDEAVGSAGSGNTGPDATGVGTDTAQVRAERVGNPKTPGNGRVYYITFSVTDPGGSSCRATVEVGVPHDQGGSSQPIGDGPVFDSTVVVPKK